MKLNSETSNKMLSILFTSVSSFWTGYGIYRYIKFQQMAKILTSIPNNSGVKLNHDKFICKLSIPETIICHDVEGSWNRYTLSSMIYVYVPPPFPIIYKNLGIISNLSTIQLPDIDGLKECKILDLTTLKGLSKQAETKYLKPHEALQDPVLTKLIRAKSKIQKYEIKTLSINAHEPVYIYGSISGKFLEAEMISKIPFECLDFKSKVKFQILGGCVLTVLGFNYLITFYGM